MSIKLTKDGLTIEVNTEEELRQVLNVLGTNRKTVSLNPRDVTPDYDLLLEMYSTIPVDSKSYEAIQLLKQRPNGMTQEELKNKLSLKSDQALGGMFGGISKIAKKHGLGSEDIYFWEYKNNKGVYRLTSEMLKALEQKE